MQLRQHRLHHGVPTLIVTVLMWCDGVCWFDWYGAGKTLPQWFDDALKKKTTGSLRYNEDYRRRIELIQDFSFPAASTRIKMSKDGNFIAAAGVYKPCIKVMQTYVRCRHAVCCMCMIMCVLLVIGVRNRSVVDEVRPIPRNQAHADHPTTASPAFGIMHANTAALRRRQSSEAAHPCARVCVCICVYMCVAVNAYRTLR